MQSDGNKTEVTDVEARAGSKEGVVRWVLIIGTLLAVILLSAIWIFGAASQDPADSQINVSDRIQAEDQAAGIDGVTIDEADEVDGTADDAAADTPLQTIEN